MHADKKELRLGVFYKKMIPYNISGAIMVGAVVSLSMILDSTIMSLVIKILVGAVVYCSCSFFYWFISNNEIRIFVRSKLG